MSKQTSQEPQCVVEAEKMIGGWREFGGLNASVKAAENLLDHVRKQAAENERLRLKNKKQEKAIRYFVLLRQREGTQPEPDPETVKQALAEHKRGESIMTADYLKEIRERDPEPDVDTVEVRIPVALFVDGSFCSNDASSGEPDWQALSSCRHIHSQADGYAMIVARVPLPKPPTEVVGTVEEPKSE